MGAGCATGVLLLEDCPCGKEPRAIQQRHSGALLAHDEAQPPPRLQPSDGAWGEAAFSLCTYPAAGSSAPAPSGVSPQLLSPRGLCGLRRAIRSGGCPIASGAHAHCTCYIPTTASFHSPGQSVTRVSRLYVPSGRGGLPMASFRRQLLMLSREAGSGKSHGKSTGGRVGRPRTVRATALRVCDGPGTTQMVN